MAGAPARRQPTESQTVAPDASGATVKAQQKALVTARGIPQTRDAGLGNGPHIAWLPDVGTEEVNRS